MGKYVRGIKHTWAEGIMPPDGAPAAPLEPLPEEAYAPAAEPVPDVEPEEPAPPRMGRDGLKSFVREATVAELRAALEDGRLTAAELEWAEARGKQRLTVGALVKQFS